MANFKEIRGMVEVVWRIQIMKNSNIKVSSSMTSIMAMESKHIQKQPAKNQSNTKDIGLMESKMA